MRQSSSAEDLNPRGAAAKIAKCLGLFKERSRFVVHEREHVSQDVLLDCTVAEAPLHFALFGVLQK